MSSIGRVVPPHTKNAIALVAPSSATTARSGRTHLPLPARSVRPTSGEGVVEHIVVPHEVLPARRERYSIAGWFRVIGNGAGRVDPPR